MSDTFGLLTLPAAAPAAGAAVTDPALDMVLAFAQAVVNADLGAAWAAVCPSDPVPVAYVFNHEPNLESFNADETPALYVWRADDADAKFRYSQDYVADAGGFNALWVPPPAEQEDRRAREAFRNGLKKALRLAFANGRHPAWQLAGDAYYQPATYGSVLLYHAKLAYCRLTAFRQHTLLIESFDKGAKMPFDCLFFVLDTLELSVKDASAYTPLAELDGTFNAPDASLDPTLPMLATQSFNFKLQLTGLTPASGPVAGGTLVTISGAQFSDEVDIEVDFGANASLVVTFVDESTITAVAPPGAAVGAVDITVTIEGGESAKLAGAYTYT